MEQYIIYEITLDLRRNLHQVLAMKEGDANSRFVHVKITDNGKPYDISSAYVTVNWEKPDDKVVQNVVYTKIDNSTVEVKCTDQMLAISGIAKVDITIATENEIISTMKFNVSIDESAVSKNIIESSSEFGALNELLSKNNSLGDDLRELESQLENAEAERVIAENERKDNEENRKTNENNRENAEFLRETNTTTAIQNTNNATNLANTASRNAEDATDAAIDAIAKTNEATQKANVIVTKMEALMKDDNIVHTSDLGVSGGVATLDENGNIPASQLPSFVDDVLEGSYNSENNTFYKLDGTEYTPESGKIYIDCENRVTYRWSGNTYVEICSSLAIGTTSSSAFPGDRGVALEKRMTAVEEYHNNIPASDIKFDNTDTTILSADVQGVLTELSQPATRTKDGLLSALDKALIDNYANVQEIEVVLSASRWLGNSAPYTQTITITDLTAYNNCSVELNTTATTEQETAIIEADIRDNILYDESTGLTFIANGIKPTIDIPILICVGTSMNVVGVPYYLGDLDEAENISYNNSDSGLNGTNVKSALDELNTELETHSHKWSVITDKPSSFTPSDHTHDSRYYTETEMDTLLSKKLPIKGALSSTIDAILEDGVYIMNGTNAVGTFPLNNLRYGTLLAMKRYSTNSLQLMTDGVNVAVRNWNNVTGGSWTQIVHEHNLSDFIVTQQFSLDNQTIAANSNGDIDISISKSNYTPIGIVGWDLDNGTNNGANATMCNVFAVCLTSSNSIAHFDIRNMAASNAVLKAKVTVLFIKNSN